MSENWTPPKVLTTLSRQSSKFLPVPNSPPVITPLCCPSCKVSHFASSVPCPFLHFAFLKLGTMQKLDRRESFRRTKENFIILLLRHHHSYLKVPLSRVVPPRSHALTVAHSVQSTSLLLDLGVSFMPFLGPTDLTLRKCHIPLAVNTLQALSYDINIVKVYAPLSEL